MSARRKALGRGLDALLSKPEPAPSADGGIGTLPIDSLRPNRFQPRSEFDEGALADLAESIRAQGIVQPIVATRTGAGQYTIIAGERRWRAARLAGLEEVPAVVREIGSDQQMLELALVENLQRADLNPVEEGEAYRALGAEFGLSQEEIARRVGKARSTITNTLRLLKLEPEILDFLRDGRLTAGQARPLAAMTDRDRAVRLARRAVEEGLSARRIEELAGDGRSQTRPRSRPTADADTAAAADRLTHRFQTKVDIRRRGKGGAVQIHFHSEEELMRLFDLLIGHRKS